MGKQASTQAADAALAQYNEKRNFAVTAEPAGVSAKRPARRAKAKPIAFVIQKHWASRLHYDSYPTLRSALMVLWRSEILEKFGVCFGLRLDSPSSVCAHTLADHWTDLALPKTASPLTPFCNTGRDTSGGDFEPPAPPSAFLSHP